MFQRLYNWIKYKALPTSFLFKNRLFLERNTKHKKIYTMLGVIFRNSKWGNFELSNIKTQFRLRYFKTFSKILIFLFLIFLLFNKFFIHQSYFLGSASFLAWLFIDSFDYYLSFITWSLIFAFYFGLNWIYTYFFEHFFYLFEKNKNSKNNVFYAFFRKKKENKVHSSKIAKHELKHLFYFWLNSYDDEKTKQICEHVFDHNSNKNFWNKNYYFFIKLFKAVYLCNLTNKNYAVINLTYDNSTFYKASFVLSYNFFNSYIPNNFAFVDFKNFLFLTTKNFTSPYKIYNKNLNPNLCYLFKLNKWVLPNLFIETQNNLNLLQIQANNLYFLVTQNTQHNYLTQNFYEINHLNFFLKSQTNSAKWNRWLYKYSLLHRRFLKNSHKISITKNLFSSGFYSLNFSNRNTWTTHRSSAFNKFASSNLNFLYYSNFFKTDKNTLSNFLTRKDLKFFTSSNKTIFLSCYENSYLWFVKRFYFFNNLNTNQMNSYNIPFFKLEKNFEQVPNLIFNFFLINQMASFPHINFNEFLIQTNLIFSQEHETYKNISNFYNYNQKDLDLFFNEFNFFSSDLLDISYWISNPTADVNNIFINYIRVIDSNQIKPLMFELFFDNSLNFFTLPNFYFNFYNSTPYYDLLFINTLK